MSGWFVKTGSESGHCCFEYSICEHEYEDFDVEKKYPNIIAETLHATEQQSHLLAAAPELYEALDALMKKYYDVMRDCKGVDVGSCGDVTYDVAGVALKKARGE